MHMAARPCTPPREGSSPEGTPFICYNRLSEYMAERSRSPSSPPARRRESRRNTVDALPEPRPSQLSTPKASRLDVSYPPAVFCTPQLMREELQLRASLDSELTLLRLDSSWRQEPSVTPLVDGLYVGGFPDSETLEFLRSERVNTIINCCAGEYDTLDSVRAEFTVHHLYAEDQSDYLILFHCYDQFASIVSEARKADRRVFVHCIAGINRSVTLCIAYLMQYHNMDPISCVRLFLSQGRTNILRNVAFRHQIVDFYIHTLST
ncbi:dual specificity protein phosphatase [Trypanosoma conorhini]|uniref:protein-tyrosine-phosphatase n=1 Tax=Trypanosoma conorhini TaxID=83891 RepID=A0A422NA20_9TRYP|nr:dual specificity protein phosphatase [Trypanosoma conorhini]RNF02329.1 dual specificity protein phosphatase [Trypanosoma conorhini]